MRVFLTGATGFIGRALSLRLVGAGHQVTAWVRDETRARTLIGPDIALASTREGSNIRSEIEGADAVVNLAGEPVFGGRWTPARKRALVESRVNLTREITQAIAASSKHPAVLISASAVGYYGDRGDQFVEDDAAAGDDFLATLCRNWEAAAIDARRSGVRVFIPRIGIVLGADGGGLARMLAPWCWVQRFLAVRPDRFEIGPLLCGDNDGGAELRRRRGGDFLRGAEGSSSLERREGRARPVEWILALIRDSAFCAQNCDASANRIWAWISRSGSAIIRGSATWASVTRHTS
jgi:nucleoside-diphosphate-sugar epimerase